MLFYTVDFQLFICNVYIVYLHLFRFILVGLIMFK